jgi:hypothetical protein
MFELMIRDLLFQQRQREKEHPLLNGKAYGAKRWIPDDPRLPKGWRPPDYKPKPRGRTPIQTRYKRLPETAEKDREAWRLRQAGLTYQQIADAMGWPHRQRACRAVQRAAKDLQSRQDKPVSARVPTGGNSA